jgi:hypothetical protein
MKMVHKETATCYFMRSETEKAYPSVMEARRAAEEYVGNQSYSKPFPNEETYLYGDRSGETTVMVRRDFGFVEEKTDEES